MDVEALIAPRVRDMQPYAPIVPLDVLSKRLGRAPHEIVKLDANENPYGTSPQGARRRRPVARAAHLSRSRIRRRCARRWPAFVGVPMEHILCGAGGDEVIDLLARAFVEPGEMVVDLPPTFGMYKWEADMLGAGYMTVPRRADFSVDVDAVERAVDARSKRRGEPPKLLFVANPNNPDGSVTPRGDLLRLLRPAARGRGGRGLHRLQPRAEPGAARARARTTWWCCARSASSPGMAGLRVGYGLLPLPVIKHLWKVKQPYTPNVAGTVAALAALADRAVARPYRADACGRADAAHRRAAPGWTG